MPELALDDRQRQAFPGELDGVRVSELMLVPTSAQTPLCRPPGYADRAGEVPQVAYVAVGRVGIIHGDSQARLMSGARSTMAGTGDRF